MNKKSYDSIVKEHLAWYKKTLGVTGDGIYTRNNRPYSHILPTGDENKNFLIDPLNFKVQILSIEEAEIIIDIACNKVIKGLIAYLK